jgi:hypothetical protein
MSSTTRRAEFFALEASEYIGDLEPLVARSDTPDCERLVRGARALRGAALMAGLGTFARAAAGMEGMARQVRDHALEWEPVARDAWREGLQTLRGLVGRATTWESADDRQALALADRLERATGGAGAPQAGGAVSEVTAPSSGMTPGVRAFIARESALIAGSLHEASQALAPTPPPQALAGVLERMRSLRGIGTSADLSPLPELLDAMEVMTRGLIASGGPSPELAAIFSAAAEALATMSKSVGDHGRVVVPAGLGAVATQLLEHHTTPVALPGAADPAVGADAGPIPVELVGVGDHLIAQADALGRQSSPSARDLRLFVLHRTLAAMPGQSGTGRFLGPLVRSVTTAIANGAASRSPDGFGTMLREAGSFLVEAAESADPGTLVARRDGLANAILADRELPRGPSGATPPPQDRPALDFTQTWATPSPHASVPPPKALPSEAPHRPSLDVTRTWATPSPEPEADVVPIEALAPDEPQGEIHRPSLDFTETWATPPAEVEVVPIASLAPDEPQSEIPRPSLDRTETWATPAAEADVVPIASLAPDDLREVTHRPSLDFTETWATPPANQDVVSIASLAPDDGDLVDIDTLAPDDRAVVPIASLAPEGALSVPEAPGDGAGRLERAFRRERVIAGERGDVPPSLEVLMGDAPVDVAVLLYRGESAVARAEELRTQLGNILAEPQIALERLRPLLDELLDLVPLARDAT